MPNQYPLITYGVVKKAFEAEGYILLAIKYDNCYQKLEYICPNGHMHSINWNKWQQGRRCPYCNIGKVGNNIKFTFDSVRLEFQKEGYVLLSTKYMGQYEKLDCICSSGHICSISWKKWRLGRRCPTCWSINRSGPTSPNWKGGISKEPYCIDWTKDLKEFIKQRDGYKCMNPSCNSKNPDDLCIHHFAYDKKACDPKDLITVCRGCNGRANKDRDWHTAWYQAIMYRRYGYDY